MAEPLADWSALAWADIVILGEVHDNPYHHQNQADAVAVLLPTALVFEQIVADLAATVTPPLLDDEALLESALRWEERGWPDFSMYYPIFTAAPNALVAGGGTPLADVRTAMSEGAAAVFGDGAEAFGLDQPYDTDTEAELRQEQQDAHCGALPVEMLPGMVQAQRLRDAELASAALDAVERLGGPVVVITGNGHATNTHAVPALLRMAAPDLTVVSVGQFEEAVPDAPDFDRWLVTDGVDRGDPCEAFR